MQIKVKGKGLVPLNLNWWKPTQRQWAPVLLKDHPAYWKKEADPTYQRPWKALQPSTIERKDRKFPGQPILRRTGLMQDSAKIVPKGQGFAVQSTPYGKYHQFGTDRMAARPWMGIPDDSLKQIAPIAWKNILSRKS